jgi:TonB family protein
MLPQFDIPVVEPTADVSKLKSKLQTPTLPQPAMVEPSADVSHLNAKSKLPALPQAALLEPTLSPDQLKLKTGQINMAQLDSGLLAPKLPVEPQRTSGTTESGGKAGKEAAANIPAQPNVSGLGATAGQGQLIALGLNPVDIRGPVSAPAGNRSGEFHASPGGKPDAPGTPNVTGTGKDADVSGGPGGKNTRAPTGIYVAQPPAGANASAVAGTPVKSPASAKPDMEARKRIIAAAMNPNLPNPARVSPPPVRKSPDVVEPTIEQRVFGKKTYYSLVLNMPNLTSATGSWIIRFAELQQNPDKSAVTAPVATTKVDPAYAPDALRDHIEGTVTLYAIIHTDGTVSQIRVLDSLDDRLDANAVHALAGWHFRPGTKNGAPVDLEAVVQIPFRMRHFQQ